MRHVISVPCREPSILGNWPSNLAEGAWGRAINEVGKEPLMAQLCSSWPVIAFPRRHEQQLPGWWPLSCIKNINILQIWLDSSEELESWKLMLCVSVLWAPHWVWLKCCCYHLFRVACLLAWGSTFVVCSLIPGAQGTISTKWMLNSFLPLLPQTEDSCLE